MNIEQGISNFEWMSNSLIRQFANSLTHAVLAESAVNAKARLIRAEGNDHFEFIMQNKPNFQDVK